MNREDPKERYAGQDAVTLGADEAKEVGASILTPDAEEEIEAATREEMRLDAEQKERLRQAASAVALPTTPAAPAGGPPPDPYTLSILQSLQMTQAALLQFIQGSTEGKSVPYHLIKHDTPWNPEGKKNRTKLRRPTFISGYPVNPILHSEQEIELLNQLKPGRYNDRKWEVARFEDGSIDIRYPNKTIPQRMEMAIIAPTLSALCTLIITERAKQDERRAQGLNEFQDDDE